jgi:hypothetical protein
MKEGNSTVDMSPAREAKKKRTQRDRMRREGFKQMTVWVHVSHQPRVRKFVAKLKRQITGDDDES